jgi:hypothetical protein
MLNVEENRQPGRAPKKNAPEGKHRNNVPGRNLETRLG